MALRIRLAVPLLLLTWLASGCDNMTPLATAPSTPSTTAGGGGGQAKVVATYDATLAASATCAANLADDVRVRQYVMTMFSDGRLDWSGPTVHQPGGHEQISSGQLNGNSFTFHVGARQADPQSDVFNGIWDTLDGNRFLTILVASGTGTVTNDRITGRFDGDFSYFSDIAPGGIVGHSAFCTATDHGFTLVKR